MTRVRRLDRPTRREGRRFMRKPRKGLTERKARLRNKRPREGRGGRFHPEGLDTYTFSRLRCKPTASALAVGLCSGAGVARRRAHDDRQDMMSDTSTSTMTTVEQLAEQPHTGNNRQHHPNVRGGGVQCQGGTPDTPPSTKREERASTGGFTVKVLRCQGCQGSSRNYRAVCVRAPAPTRSNDGLVWTPDTHDTVFRCSKTGTSNPLPSGRVSAPPNPPTPDIRNPLPLSAGLRLVGGGVDA